MPGARGEEEPAEEYLARRTQDGRGLLVHDAPSTGHAGAVVGRCPQRSRYLISAALNSLAWLTLPAMGSVGEYDQIAVRDRLARN